MSSTTQFAVMQPMPALSPARPAAAPTPSLVTRLGKRLAVAFRTRRRRPQVLYLDRLSLHLQRDIGLGP